MDNVPLDQPPVAGHHSTFHLCGQNVNYYVINFESVRVTSGTVINQVFEDTTGVGFNQHYCFKVNFELTKGESKIW